MRNSIVGLDIGTSKICAAIAARDGAGKDRLIGIGTADAKGINKGFVSNLDKLVDSINKAVQSAEDASGVKARYVVSNISGASVSGKTQEGLIPLARHGREITKRDIKKVIETTRSVSLTMEREILYAVPQEFIVDDNHGVEDPLGLFGSRLKVRLYVVTAQTAHVQNISKAVNYAGYELIEVIPTSIASASAMLQDKDKDDGTIMVDMGGGITEIAIFYSSMLKFLDSVNVGGMDLTARLSARFNIPFSNAEIIKKSYGAVSESDLKKDEKNAFDIGNRRVVVNTSDMNTLLRERLDEIFFILQDRIKSSSTLTPPIPNLVITGGSALLGGALEAFEALFNMHTRLGRICMMDGNPSTLANPAYTAAICLAKYGLNRHVTPKSGFLKGRSFVVDTALKFKEMLDEYF